MVDLCVVEGDAAVGPVEPSVNFWVGIAQAVDAELPAECGALKRDLLPAPGVDDFVVLLRRQCTGSQPLIGVGGVGVIKAEK